MMAGPIKDSHPRPDPVPRRTKPCQTPPSRTMPDPNSPYRATPNLTLPNHAKNREDDRSGQELASPTGPPCLTRPSRASPSHAQPCQNPPCRTVPYRTTPSHTRPSIFYVEPTRMIAGPASDSRLRPDHHALPDPTRPHPA